MAEHEEKDDGGEFQVVPKRKAARLRKMVETEDGKMKIVDVPRKPRETATHRAQKRTHNEMSSESIEDDTLPKRRPYFPPLKRTRRLVSNVDKNIF